MLLESIPGQVALTAWQAFTARETENGMRGREAGQSFPHVAYICTENTRQNRKHIPCLAVGTVELVLLDFSVSVSVHHQGFSTQIERENKLKEAWA